MTEPSATSFFSPGKLVLIGEYAVLDGGAAVVLSVDHGVGCERSPHPSQVEIFTPDGDVRFVQPALENAPAGTYRFYDTHPQSQIIGKLGFGGSAAATVAACAAAGRPLNDAYALHRTVQTDGSGVDVAAAIHGGMLRYQKTSNPNDPPQISPIEPIKPVVIWSGQSAQTTSRIRIYRSWKDADARMRFVDSMNQLVEQFHDDPVNALRKAGILLADMAKQTGIPYLTPTLSMIMELAEAHGGASKPSGAGGGDCAVALFPTPEAQHLFEEDCERHGLPVIPVDVANGPCQQIHNHKAPTMAQPTLSKRKSDHLALCRTDSVEFREKTSLFEKVDFVHDALPDMAVDDVDLSCSFAGKPLQAPLVIAAMTGGTQEAERINQDLAWVAESLGIGFALGSQRPLLTEGNTLGYQVREHAPNALVIGNIGVVQATEASTQQIIDLVSMTQADALAIHLNPAMEVVQPEGDHNFRGGLDTIQRLVEGLSVPVIAKETGCGISRKVGRKLLSAGVAHVDTSGSGGTSWVGVEALRAQGDRKQLGDAFWNWGIPTAASVAQLTDLKLQICATGGIKTGIDVAKAIAMGASCAGIARPFLQAHAKGGRQGALDFARQIIHSVRIVCLLTGSKELKDLRSTALVISDPLRGWIPTGTSLHDRIGPHSWT